MNPDELLTAAQAAKRLAVSKRTLYRWSERNLPVVTLLGRTKRWRAADIEALISTGKQGQVERPA